MPEPASPSIAHRERTPRSSRRPDRPDRHGDGAYVTVPVNKAWVDPELLVDLPPPKSDPIAQARLLARCGRAIEGCDLAAWAQSVALSISERLGELDVARQSARTRYDTARAQVERGTLAARLQPAPAAEPRAPGARVADDDPSDDQLAPLTPQAALEGAQAAHDEHLLKVEVRQHCHLKWKAIGATVLLGAVDLAITYQLNTLVAPGSNPIGGDTVLDQLMRVTAATMMLVTLSAAVIIGQRAADARIETWQRWSAAAVASVLGSGAVVIAASVCHPAFGGAIEALVLGSPGATGMAVGGADGSLVGLPLRLLSGVPVIAVGLLAGLMELRAIRAAAEERGAALRLAQRQARLATHATLEAAEFTWRRCAAEAACLRDPKQQERIKSTAIAAAMAAYIDALQALAPAVVEPTRETEASLLQRERQTQQHARLLSDFDAIRSGPRPAPAPQPARQARASAAIAPGTPASAMPITARPPRPANGQRVAPFSDAPR